MNIISNSVYPYVQKLNSKQNSPKYTYLSGLQKDTVSFGAAANMRKRVEELKMCNSGGKHNIKKAEVERIYEYFGFKKKSENTHLKYEGPYGQTVVLKRQTNIDPGTVRDLIEAIKRADEFNGELILFESEPSQEEIDAWKKRIAERSPKNGYVNQYAIDTQTEKTNETLPVEESVSVDKEDDKEINLLKMNIDNFLTKISLAKKDFAQVKKSFMQLKAECSNSNITLPNNIISTIEEQIDVEDKKLHKMREDVVGYKEKISSGKTLSPDEKKMFEQYVQTEISFERIKSDISVAEEQYFDETVKKEELSAQITDLVNQAGESLLDLEIKLGDITDIMKDAVVYPCLNVNDLREIQAKIDKFQESLELAHKELEKQESVELEHVSINKLQKMYKSLTKLIGTSISSLGTDANNIQDILNKKVLPYITYSDEERAAARQKRIDDFNKKVSGANSKKQKPLVEQKPVNTQVVENKNVEVPVVEQKPEVKTPEITPPVEKTPLNVGIREIKIKQLKDKLSEKIVPLPFAVAKSEIQKLVDSSFDVEQFSSVVSDKMAVQSFLNGIVANLSNKPEYKQVKNASKMALISHIAPNSSDVPAMIYDISTSQMKDLYAQIKSGEKTLQFATAMGQIITVELNNKINIEELERTFEKYRVPIRNMNQKESDPILDKILSYVSNVSDKEHSGIMLSLLEYGAYMSLLNDENSSDNMKLTLLKDFWQDYDAKNNTSYTSQVVENFELEQQRKNAIEIQKNKLNSVDDVDWSL